MAEAMSSTQAVRFDHFSQVNADIVETSFPCECEAYKDVFTYRRWSAQGMQVRRGEKAVKITTFRPVKDEEGEIIGRAPVTSAVFCRHQVEVSE